jgi:hypothetical protein
VLTNGSRFGSHRLTGDLLDWLTTSTQAVVVFMVHSITANCHQPLDGVELLQIMPGTSHGVIGDEFGQMVDRFQRM